jgi:hypothetical protein
LFVSVRVLVQDEPQNVSPLVGQTHEPAAQTSTGAQTCPPWPEQPPQLFVSVCVLAQYEPQQTSADEQQADPQTWEGAQVHIPFAQMSNGFCRWQAWSTAGSLSTMPSQSSSRPSQTSGE